MRPSAAAPTPSSADEPPAGEAQESPDGGAQEPPAAASRARKRPGGLSAAALQKAAADYSRRGLVYLSRLPPFMKPAKLRFLLQQHAEVLRIYLAAEGESDEGAAAGSTRASRPARRGRAHAAQARGWQQRQALQGGVSPPPPLPQASSLLTPPPPLPTPLPDGSSLRTRRLRVASPSS